MAGCGFRREAARTWLQGALMGLTEQERLTMAMRSAPSAGVAIASNRGGEAAAGFSMALSGRRTR